MKSFLAIFIALCVSAFFANNSIAQDWLKNSQSSSCNFYEIQKDFYSYYQDKEMDKDAEDSEWHHFKRWEWFTAPRVYPTGESFRPDATWKEWQSYKQTHANTLRSSTASWVSLGPNVIPTGGGGVGRVNCIAFHPTISNTFWIGAPNGGLWKTTDDGNTWTTNTDLLPNISIADIAIDPLNPNNMYIATGDGYGYNPGWGFWGGTYSAGVLKSSDGGTTWNTTGLNWDVSQTSTIRRLIIHPANPSILLAAASTGIWRTTDGGANWTTESFGNFYDVEFNTADPSIVYTSSTSVYKSTDTGDNWSVMSGANSCFTGRYSLAVSPANSNVIYALCASGTLYKSTDGGTSWSTTTSSGVTLYGYYDTVLEVSPADANVVVVGGMNMYRSTDGGGTWTYTQSGMHVDNHAIEFLPGSSTTLFSGNDGGIYKSINAGLTWTDLSDDLAITQFYRLGGSATNKNIVYAGAQDNGIDRYSSGAWKYTPVGDGMECLVDYTDENTVYVCSQYGSMRKSTDGGLIFNSLSAPGGAWTTPYVIHPTNPLILFYGASSGEVYKSTDGGNSWNAISFSLGSSITSLAVAPSDGNVIYASDGSSLNKTTDGGGLWTDISSGLPGNYLTGIAVHNTDPNKIWVTFSGFSSGSKVYKSTDGGSTWTNASGTLPNIPANCIVYENGSADEGLYVGTDLGVFYTDNTQSDWIPYMTGLPNVIVDELEIHYGSQKIRAATYGRGLWESDLYGVNTGLANEKSLDELVQVYPNPSNGRVILDLKFHKAQDVDVRVLNLLGEKVMETKREKISADKFSVDLSSMPNGIYLFRIHTDSGWQTRKISLVKQ